MGGTLTSQRLVEAHHSKLVIEVEQRESCLFSQVSSLHTLNTILKNHRCWGLPFTLLQKPIKKVAVCNYRNVIFGCSVQCSSCLLSHTVGRICSHGTVILINLTFAKRPDLKWNMYQILEDRCKGNTLSKKSLGCITSVLVIFHSYPMYICV